MEKMDKESKGFKTLPTIFDFYTEVRQPCPHLPIVLFGLMSRSVLVSVPQSFQQ